MPKIYQSTCLEVTPEKFIQQCSDRELYELDLLMNSPRVQAVICKINQASEIKDEVWKQHREALEDGRFP